MVHVTAANSFGPVKEGGLCGECTTERERETSVEASAWKVYLVWNVKDIKVTALCVCVCGGGYGLSNVGTVYITVFSHKMTVLSRLISVVSFVIKLYTPHYESIEG